MKRLSTFVLFSLLGSFPSINAYVIPRWNNPTCHIPSSLQQLSCDLAVRFNILVPEHKRSTDCVSFMRTTYTPPPVTSTATKNLGSTSTETTQVILTSLVPLSNTAFQKRSVPTPTPHATISSGLPAYAWPCRNASRYSKACMCLLDITTRPTVTAATPTTLVTATISEDVTTTVTEVLATETWISFHLQSDTDGVHDGEYVTSGLGWATDINQAVVFVFHKQSSNLKVLVGGQFFWITGDGLAPTSSLFLVDDEGKEWYPGVSSGRYDGPFFSIVFWAGDFPRIGSSPSPGAGLVAITSASTGFPPVNFIAISN